ncbi:minichromosome maintenance protein MCM [Nanoarchaeota archaeon]
MDASQEIAKFQEFFEKTCYDELLENVRKGKRYIYIDFTELAKFSPEIADSLLEMPEETIKASEIAIERFDLEGDVKHFRVRFTNIPESQHVPIRDIRSKHLDKMVQVYGIIRQKSDVRPQVVTARFECPSCGNVINVIQIDSKFKEPGRCSCGRKGKFRLLSKELVDAQKIVLEESPEDLEGSDQPKRLNVFLKNDLVSPMSEKRTNPGSKVLVNGVIKEVPIITQSGAKSVRYDLMMDANYVEPVQEDYTQIDLDKERVNEIIELSKDPKIYEKLVGSVAPSIYGHEKVKEALLLQMMGGVKKERKKGGVTRGDIHILLIGDPGSGKSVLLKRITSIAPKARYVSGPASTAAGLTATVVKDEFLRGYALEAGAMVLANKGLCAIDELDKMNAEDRSAMHEALEQQTVSITKANIQATLRAETTLLAAANPKFGRFDPYELLAKQIELPSTLINRFDLIFPIRDLPSKEKDEKMATFILDLHRRTEWEEGDVDPDLMRDYVAYARQNVKPKLLESAVEEIKNYFVQMRNTAGDEAEGIRSIPISARQLEALVRLSEASARTRLSDKVTIEDSRKAIDLVHFCLSQIGLDPETGKIDIDRISSGITATQRSNIHVIREVITDLEKTLGKAVPYDDIVREAEIKGVGEEKVEEIIEKLKRSGDIFTPKPGMIQRI